LKKVSNVSTLSTVAVIESNLLTHALTISGSTVPVPKTPSVKPKIASTSSLDKLSPYGSDVRAYLANSAMAFNSASSLSQNFPAFPALQLHAYLVVVPVGHVPSAHTKHVPKPQHGLSSEGLHGPTLAIFQSLSVTLQLY